MTSAQVETFKLSVSAACRRMSADQILDLADHLHDIIRNRGACCIEAPNRSFAPRNAHRAIAGGAAQ